MMKDGDATRVSSRTRVLLICAAIATAFLVGIAVYAGSRRGSEAPRPGRRETGRDSKAPAQVGTNHWKISASLKEKYLEDAGRLNSELQLKPTPGTDPQEVTELRIAKVSQESPMYRAGFRQNDRILKVNGAPVTSMSRAVNLVHEIRGKTRLTVQVERDGKISDYRFDFE